MWNAYYTFANWVYSGVRPILDMFGYPPLEEIQKAEWLVTIETSKKLDSEFQAELRTGYEDFLANGLGKLYYQEQCLFSLGEEMDCDDESCCELDDGCVSFEMMLQTRHERRGAGLLIIEEHAEGMGENEERSDLVEIFWVRDETVYAANAYAQEQYPHIPHAPLGVCPVDEMELMTSKGKRDLARIK